MKFSTVLTYLAVLATTALAVTLSFDTTFDNANGSLTTVACSDGANGLITRGFPKFGFLPKFPRIGAAPAVGGWNSPTCGTCWELTYTNAQGGAKSINVIAIDVGGTGFNIALAAMNDLTNGQAVQLGRVNVTSRQAVSSACGF